MKVKVLKLGEAAREVEVQEGATVKHVIQSSGFNSFEKVKQPVKTDFLSDNHNAIHRFSVQTLSNYSSIFLPVPP